MSPSLRILVASLAAAAVGALAIASCSATTAGVPVGDAASSGDTLPEADVGTTAGDVASSAPLRAPVELDPAVTVATPGAPQTVGTEPATTEPATTEPATTDPATTAPAATEQAAGDPAGPAVERPVAPAVPPIEPVGTDDGPATKRAQERLLELGFWLQVANGEYGVSTTQAVMAFQKFYGLETDGVLGPVTAEALSSVTVLPNGRANTGDLVEVDKTKQLVFIVRDGQTEWILNTSTGTEIPYSEPNKNDPDRSEEGDSVTRTGLFRVNREREEGWWEGDLGEIYRPKYFDGGIALHGAYNVPDYPASHGCVRLSIQAMDWIWETGAIPMGTPVWVHGQIPSREA